MLERTVLRYASAAARRPLPPLPPRKASLRIAEREALRRARLEPALGIVEQWEAWRAARRTWFSGSPAAGR